MSILFHSYLESKPGPPYDIPDKRHCPLLAKLRLSVFPVSKVVAPKSWEDDRSPWKFLSR